MQPSDRGGRVRPEVLLVEDNPGDRLLFRRMLERGSLDPNVSTAATLEAALDLSRNARFDCAVIDYQLPDGTATDILTEMATAAVVLTSLDAEDLEMTTLKAGAQEFLTKGTVSTETLEAAIQRAMDRQSCRDRLVAENSRLREQSSTDPLTGLFNRRGLSKELQREAARSQRSGLPLSALLIDCDDFKAINSEHGHTGGDQALRFVARVLRSSIRPIDVAARVGGDEFVILLPQTGIADATRVGARVQQALLDHEGIPVTVTAGVCVLDTASPELDVTDVLGQCQAALQTGKARGKDQLVSVDTRAIRRFLQAGPTPNGFAVTSHNVVHLGTRAAIGTEFLAAPYNLGLHDRRSVLLMAGADATRVDLAGLEAALRATGNRRTPEYVVDVMPATVVDHLATVTRLLDLTDTPVCVRLSPASGPEEVLARAITALQRRPRTRIALTFDSLSVAALSHVVRLGPGRIFVPAPSVIEDTTGPALFRRLVSAITAAGTVPIVTAITTEEQLDFLAGTGILYGSGPLFQTAG